MRLELANFPVKDARFSSQTRYHRGVLEIDKEELKARFAGDADGKRPFIYGFRGHGGFRSFGGPAPAE